MGSIGRLDVRRVTVTPIIMKHHLKPSLKISIHICCIGEPFLPVISQSPDNSAASIQDIEEHSNYGKIVIIMDEGETKCFGVVPHQAIGQENAKQSKPNLGDDKI